MSDNGHSANKDRLTMAPRFEGYDLSDQLWGYDDFGGDADKAAEAPAGLVSLAFIWAAIRRGRRLWGAMAFAGLVAGLSVYLALPHPYQAATSVLLTFGPYENATTAASDNQVIADSNAVAGSAVRKLGLAQSASSFAGSYAVAAESPRVLLITANASSSNEAVRRANAVAASFLQFRARELETEQRLVSASLAQQISQTRLDAKAVNRQISQLLTQPTSAAQQAKLSSLRAQYSQLASELSSFEQSAGPSLADATTMLAVRGSKVLDPATPLPHSRLKRPLTYAGAGLLLGLVLGIGIVVVMALISDRLRRRDDVAHALGAPVKLSVGTVPLTGWRPGMRRLEAARGAGVQLIVAHLDRAVPARSSGPAALAVVPVDRPQAAALAVAALAVSRAQQGEHVVVADLCRGAPAASLLGATNPGVQPVSIDGAQLVVAVPDQAEVQPAGPFGDSSPQRSPFTEAAVAACDSADLLLSLAPLEPSLGGENLATWTAAAVAVVTAGKSSATRVHAVGEMIRLAGVTLESAVLIGADKADESLGMTYDPVALSTAGGPAQGVSR